VVRALAVVAVSFAIVLAACIVLVAFAIPSTLAVRARLEDGRGRLEQARSALIAGDLKRAADLFASAEASFDAATNRAHTNVLNVAAVLPALGGNIDVVRSLGTAGSKTARAGAEVADAVGRLPAGIDSLAPRNGRIPLERFPPLAGAVARADELVSSATADVRSGSTASFLFPPVEDARVRAEWSLSALHDSLGSAAAVLDRLPAFLGGDGPRTYLFGAENPAELRGTGGLIGAYALLRTDDGRLSLSPFRPIQSLPVLDLSTLPAPNPDYERLYYPQRTGSGFWLNANMTPDFPSAARSLEAALASAEGTSVDGVVTADPFALRALLESTGPTRVPGLGVEVTADNVVQFLANGAYAEIDQPSVRKQVLGEVAETVLERFLENGPEDRWVAAVADAAGESHVKVYVDDPELERALVGTGAGGAFRPADRSPSDLLSVVVNNGAGNKVDYYADREVRYVVRLHDDGTATATTEVRLTNHAPEGGLPAYVLGPMPGVTDRAGQNLSILNVYCGLCRLTGATRDGEPFDPGVDHELGSSFFQDYVKLDAGSSATTRFEYTLPGTWVGDSSGGTYTLRFLGQPTIRDTTLDVRVHVPDGMHVTDATGGARSDGAFATWSGTPSRTLQIDLAFAPSLPQRLWRELID
jgi:hypothetical protein